jgi:DNA-binding winged helix-turn-helix (wHTH) protein
MAEPAPRVHYRFGHFRVDAHQRLLFADGASAPVPLPPRVFDTLLYFVQRPGELLTKQQLLEAVWPHAIVEENSLNQHVSMLRRVLGESPGEHRFIVTAPGRGYRFVAEVSVVESRPAAPVNGHNARETPRPRDEEAHRLYQQALGLSLRPSFENTRGAIELLREATRRDPTYARAASLLAVQYTTCVVYDFPLTDALALAEREAERSLRLDPSDGTTHGAVGVVEAVRGNWISSATHFRTSRALGADPFTSGMESAYLTQSVGYLRKALTDAEAMYRAAENQPTGARMMALACLFAGRDDEALRYADLCMQMGQPRLGAPLSDIYWLLAIRSGRYMEAARYIVGAMSPDMQMLGGAMFASRLCSALGGAVARDSALAALDELQSNLPPEQLDQPMRKRFILWRTMLGDVDGAFAYLHATLDHYARLGTVGSAWGVLWLPEMQPIRDDARFEAFARRIGWLDYWREYGPPDATTTNPSTG